VAVRIQGGVECERTVQSSSHNSESIPGACHLHTIQDILGAVQSLLVLQDLIVVLDMPACLATRAVLCVIFWKWI